MSFWYLFLDPQFIHTPLNYRCPIKISTALDPLTLYNLYLLQPPRVSLDGYKHVVNVVYCPAVDSGTPTFQQETARAKAAAQVSPSSKKAAMYHDMLEGMVLVVTLFFVVTWTI